MKRFTAILGIFLLGALARADSPRPPYPKATTSGGGSAVFVMTPVREGVGSGTMYLVREDGALEKKWTVSGWYSHEVFLTNDGDFLVRLGPWNSGSQPRKEDLAIAFYKAGRLLKSYSTAELIEDPKRVRQSVSHYEWRAPDAPYIGMGEFWMTTIEGRFFVFDLASGAIKSVRPAKK